MCNWKFQVEGGREGREERGEGGIMVGEGIFIQVEGNLGAGKKLV